MQENMFTQTSAANEAFSHLTIHLLKGPLYASEKPQLWERLLEQQAQVKAYLVVIGLTLYLDEAEGFAFVKQIESEQDDDERPRLIARRPLGFGLSVLAVLLRRWLAEHDTQAGDVRAMIQRSLIQNELELFLPQENSEKKRTDRINKYIKDAINLGLIKPLSTDDDVFEILRITKAVINTQWLGDLQERLDQYRNHKRFGEERDHDT